MALVRTPTLEERRLKALARLEAQAVNYVAGVRDGTVKTLVAWKAREAEIRETLDALDELAGEAPVTRSTASSAVSLEAARESVEGAQVAVGGAQVLLRDAAEHLDGRVQGVSARVLLADLVLLERKLAILLEVTRHTLRAAEGEEGDAA